MISVYTIDDHGNFIEELPLPATDEIELGDNTIILRPDWPPIGSPDFAQRLRAWHLQHNPSDDGLIAIPVVGEVQ